MSLSRLVALAETLSLSEMVHGLAVSPLQPRLLDQERT